MHPFALILAVLAGAAPADPPRQAPPKETPVRLVRLVPPVFPPRAEKARWEAGKAHAVSLRVQVDSEGVAQRVNVLRGVHGPWGFDESATDAALASTYAPATRGGIPVGGSLEFTVTFQAQDARR